ncbi:hypothetical protein AQUCO_00500219v1 [Aquilegia coerulea]|uniref:Kinesin motor domain-containing protein n=1 Tax=Aquilegia coerulea TaxID=218851 RepID=A0A2G5ER42_AQUCA|nr:hypothetical protein AQUCO_00500219v1 [Aquilegia coerulea]
MKKSNAEIPESRFLGGISTQSLRNLLPRSISNTQQKLNKSKFSKENTPPPPSPINPNIQIDNNNIPPDPKKLLTETKITSKDTEGITKSENQQDISVVPSDPSVKVVVRIRPGNWRERGDRTVRKVCPNSLVVGDRTFTFDSVVDSSSTQEDVFQLVGVPLVKNSLAGYNTSILSCGQTGSGKTYTMWGPPSAMVEGHSPISNQGIVPRIFQMLFTEIQEQENSEDKHINYQCRCSFLEIYNEQIGDLLDPTQRNLQIRDDAKNGFYVENLTEEYVTCYDDVTQILIKGLSNRKVGATTINSKSSRSHIVFTCVIESWCKGTSSKCFSSSKTSRISLIDVAGSERNKLDDAGRECVKEGRNVKKSLSQLGHLVHILAKGAQSERSENIPYTNSCLTHLLKESLGGNAKLTIICAISPDEKCKGETLSTLRFGVKAKSIQNEPVENEIKEDDVNDLSDRIRQLKEELIKEKSTGVNSVGYSSSYFKGKSARDSLNQLRVSLNRSMILPRLDNDSKDVTTIDEKDVKELCVQMDNLRSSGEENFQDAYEETDFQDSCEETDGEHEDDHLSDKFEKELCSKDIGTEGVASCGNSSALHRGLRSSLSISPCEMPSYLQEPTLSESPKFENIQMKSLPTSSNLSSSHVPQSSNTNSEVEFQSVKRSDRIRESLRSSKMFSSPTESLAASLHRGLQLIDYHQRASASKSSVALSFEHLALRSSQAIKQGDASVPTLIERKTHLDGPATPFICATCKQESKEVGEVQDSLNMCIVPCDEPRSSGLKAVKDGEKVVDEALKREELEKVCAEQAAKIEQLNILVEQYKHEKEQNLLIQKAQEISTIHAFSGGVGGMQDLEKEKHILLLEEKEDEIKILEDASDAEISTAKSELRGIQEEKEGLLKEIDILKNKLQCYVDVSWIESQSTKLRESYNANSSNKMEKELEEERERWIEKESEWICLTDELRVDLDSNRRHAENVEMELRLEKRVTEELDDALNRAVLGHARFVEHYADLQDKYNELLERHQKIMDGIAEVKRAAAKAGAKGKGSRFAKSLAAELSVLRVEREREREHLKKENKSLRIQLRDTAEAVHAAGELLVRLREAEEAVSVAEESYIKAQKESEKVKKQMEKQKRKHAMEMVTMKQYLAESRLPESALQPMYWQEEEKVDHTTTSPLPDDDQAWRAEFGPIYQEHY